MYAGQLVFAQLMEHLPLADVSTHRRALRRRSSRAQFQLRESMALHGLRAARVSRESARHRDLPAFASGQALSPWDSRNGGAQHAGRRERSARLAYLRRVRAAPHSHCAPALSRRALRRGSQEHRLRARFHHDRLVFDAVPVGTLPIDQGGGQTAHVDRPARQHPELHPHLRRETARRQRARRVAARARRLLRDGPRLSRLRAPASVALARSLLRDPRQIQSQGHARLLPRRRSIHRTLLRFRRSRSRCSIARRAIPRRCAAFGSRPTRARRWCS